MGRLREHAGMLAFACAALCWPAATCGAAAEIPLPSVTGEFDGAVYPRNLPRDHRLGVSVEMEGSFATLDGSPLPALREAVIDFGPDARINPNGFPKCHRQQLEFVKSSVPLAGCKNARSGSGIATVVEAAPAREFEAHLTAYNGGGSRAAAKIFVAMDIVGIKDDPPVTVVKVRRHSGGNETSLRTIWRLPPLLDGAASLRDFKLKFGRTDQSQGRQRNYLEASCPTDQVTASVVRAVLKDERGTGIGDQILAGEVALPCK
jgi:hypothetical protein